MKIIEVLTITSPNEKNVMDVFLHDPETGIVMREDTAPLFTYRTLLPHAERLEVRQISISDERITDALWYLRTMPKGNTRNFSEYHLAFQEIFLIASGFYSPQQPRKFPLSNEKITHAAVIFPFIGDDGEESEFIMMLGKRHPECFEKMFLQSGKYIKEHVRQGFYTDKGRFLDRYEAKQLALANGQLKENSGWAELYSEDLW